MTLYSDLVPVNGCCMPLPVARQLKAPVAVQSGTASALEFINPDCTVLIA
jgi:hypothetical protein